MLQREAFQPWTPAVAGRWHPLRVGRPFPAALVARCAPTGSRCLGVAMCGALRQMIHLGATCLALCRSAPFPPLPYAIGWKKSGPRDLARAVARELGKR